MIMFYLERMFIVKFLIRSCNLAPEDPEVERREILWTAWIFGFLFHTGISISQICNIASSEKNKGCSQVICNFWLR